MKSFKEFFGEERRRPNAGPTKDAIEAARQKLSQQFAAASARRPTPLSNADIVDAARTKGGSAAVPKTAPEAGVWLGSDDQAIKDAREALRKQAQRRASKSVEAASNVGQAERTQAANAAARARETRPAQRRPLGNTTIGGPVKVTTLKPSKPAPAPKPEAIKQSAVSAKQAAYRKRVATQGRDLLKSIQGGRETTARMGRAYGKNLAATADDIIKGIGAERKAETAAGNKEFRKLRYGRGKSGPATDLRTDAQTRTYQTGAKKGYFDPKTGRVSETGLQKHANMRAVGGENFGKFKGKDPREALSKVSNVVSRAQGGDRAARSEIRRSYKSITSKYKPQTGARAGFGSADFRTFQQQAANVNAPKLTPQKMSMNLPGTQQKPVSSPAAQATKEKLRQKLDLKLNAKSQKGGALGFPVQTGIVPSKAGELAIGTKPGQLAKRTKGGELALGTKPGQLATQQKPQPQSQPKSSSYRGIGAGKSVEIAGAPKPTKTPILTPGKPAGTQIPSTYTPPKVDKGPAIDVTSPSATPSGKKSFKKFTKQAGTTSSRKGSWSYTPQQTAANAALKDAQKSTATSADVTPGTGRRKMSQVKAQNPASYQREVERRAKNISSIKRGKVLGALGKVANVGFAAYDAYDVYKQQRDAGQSKEYATKRAIGQAGGGAAGAAAGGKLGAAIGTAIAPGVGTLAGGVLGGIAGYAVGSGAGKALVGASQKDKDWMKWANRKTQTGTAAADAQFKSGNKAVIKDKTGQERVGYKAFKDGKTVYKHANTPQSLRYTSSNPLERLGRTVAQSNLGPVSDWMKSRYAASDAEARKKKIASVKAAASK